MSELQVAEKILWREEIETLLGESAKETAERNRLTEKLNAKVTAARQEFEKAITDCELLIAEKSLRVEALAKEHKSEFADPKSVPFLHGVIGFNQGRRKTDLLDGFTWEKALQIIRTKFRSYVRIKREINLAKILTDSSDDVNKLNEAQLKKMGIKIVREEKFYIDLKSEVAA
jgi:phage host-nuclease inhibitor protein Gam